MTKKHEKKLIHVLSVDFLLKISYYAVGNYHISLHIFEEGRSIHEYEKGYCQKICDTGC